MCLWLSFKNESCDVIMHTQTHMCCQFFASVNRLWMKLGVCVWGRMCLQMRTKERTEKCVFFPFFFLSGIFWFHYIFGVRQFFFPWYMPRLHGTKCSFVDKKCSFLFSNKHIFSPNISLLFPTIFSTSYYSPPCHSFRLFFLLFLICSDDGNFLLRLTDGKRPTKKEEAIFIF